MLRNGGHGFTGVAVRACLPAEAFICRLICTVVLYVHVEEGTRGNTKEQSDQARQHQHCVAQGQILTAEAQEEHGAVVFVVAWVALISEH